MLLAGYSYCMHTQVLCPCQTRLKSIQCRGVHHLYTITVRPIRLKYIYLRYFAVLDNLLPFTSKLTENGI